MTDEFMTDEFMTDEPHTKEGLMAYFHQFLGGADRGEASAEVLADICLTVEAVTEKRVREETEKRVRAELVKASTTIPATAGPVMTLRQWFDAPELRQLWAATWEHPVMKAGLQVLFHAGMPRPLTHLPVGVDLATALTLREGRYEGFYDSLRLIEKLKKEPSRSPGGDDQLDEGWGGADLNNPPK